MIIYTKKYGAIKFELHHGNDISEILGILDWCMIFVLQEALERWKTGLACTF